LAHPACTAENQEAWNGPIDTKTLFTVHIINLLFPFDFLFDAPTNGTSPLRVHFTQTAMEACPTRWQRMRLFLCAPLSKFYYHTIYIVGYAAVAITVALGDLHAPELGRMEWILLGWTVAAAVEMVFEWTEIGASIWSM
jgi:hypothetical protein